MQRWSTTTMRAVEGSICKSPPNCYPARYGYGSSNAGYNSGPSISLSFPQGTVP